MRPQRWITTLFFLLTSILMLSTPAARVYAQTGTSIENAFHLDAKASGLVVHLNWDRPLAGLSTPYSVFRIDVRSVSALIGDTTALGDTVLVTTTSDTSYVDSVTYPRPVSFPAPAHAFAYFVTAKTVANVLIQSNLASVIVSYPDNWDQVKIISIPPLTAQVGVQYSYTVKAVSSNSSAVIHYFLNEPPLPVLDVVRCDSITGVVTMTPIVRGIVPIHVVAVSNMGGRGDQEFQVIVSGANGIISGRVTDTLSHPIKGVLINALKRDAHAAFSYSAITDSLGNYRIAHIDLGSYYIHAIPLSGDFLDQWYDGKASPAQANPVIVADSPSVAVADFKLRSRSGQQLPLFTVGGTVTDTLGVPLPVAGTQVFFINADFAFNAVSMRQYLELNRDIDFRLRGNSPFVFKTGIDSTGTYSIKIPEGAYIALAVSPGYAPQFYSGKAYFLVGDVIRLTSDSLGIDFSLSALPPLALGEISGQVLDSVANVGVRARMIAFREPEMFVALAGFHPIRALFTETDSAGFYTFDDLIPGSYYIFALPVGNYSPVFYSDGSQDVRWNKATPIAIDGNSLSGINLYPHPLPDSCRGYTMINGNVSHSGSMTGAFGGALVFASDQNGAIAGYTLSDAQGKFVIDGLAPGTYIVSADVPGYTLANSAQSSPSYDGMGNSVPGNVSLALQTTSVKTVEQTIPTGYSLDQNYPNPFNPSTTIRYTLPASGNVSIRVYNVLGQLVSTLVDARQNAGTYEVTFNATAFSSGVYFYRVESGSFTAVKKMMLLK